MKYYFAVYNVLNVLTMVVSIKTPILRNSDGSSDSSSKMRNNLPLVDLVELKAANGGIISESVSKEIFEHHKIKTLADVPEDFGDDSNKEILSKKNENCWMSLNAKQHFQIMDNLDERYRKVRSDYQKQLGEGFDIKMLETLLEWRGVAQREAFKTSSNTNLIPAGLNLGGYCMMKMKDSVLFFHRIKLRNQTHFRINFLHTDVENMALVIRLSLNDLHLLGAYERSPIDKDPSVLFYAPTFGEVEFLLKNVDFNIEARLRLMNKKLAIELVTSEFKIEDILMMYINCADCPKPIRLIKENIEDFLDRMKTDLDKWLKDYFNDYLTYFGSLKTPSSQFLQAEKDKIIALNEYADSSLNIIRNRLRQLGANTVKIPYFTIYGTNQMKLKLTDGVLRGLDSMYRRSVTTAKKENDIRKVNLIVGFSNLKVMYKYEASLRVDVPPLIGIIVLSADEITAHMELSLVNEPETVDLEVDFIQQMKPESLTVEGAASRLIANFKHLLEHHIIAIMSNAVIHNIKMLRTLSRCEPMLLSQHKSNKFSKIKAKADFLNTKSDTNSQNPKASQSESGQNDTPSKFDANNELQNVLHNQTTTIDTYISSGGDKISSVDNKVISDESGNRYGNEEDISESNNNPNDNGEIFHEENEMIYQNTSQEDNKFISEIDNTDSGHGKILSELSSNDSPNDENVNSTGYLNVDTGLILSRNDSVELELSESDRNKGGKFKLNREEKIKLIKSANTF